MSIAPILQKHHHLRPGDAIIMDPERQKPPSSKKGEASLPDLPSGSKPQPKKIPAEILRCN